MRSILASVSPVAIVTFAMLAALAACREESAPSQTPSTTQTTSGSWDTPNLGPSQSADYPGEVTVDAGRFAEPPR